MSRMETGCTGGQPRAGARRRGWRLHQAGGPDDSGTAIPVCPRPPRGPPRTLTMKLPRVYPILDTESLEKRGVGIETAAASFLEGGAGILQIRHKGHWTRAKFDTARVVARLCHESGAVCIVNDRADIAM